MNFSNKSKNDNKNEGTVNDFLSKNFFINLSESLFCLSFFAIILFSNVVFGQAKKEIKKLGVKTQTTSQKKNDGSELKDSFERYDKKGNVTEEIVYNSEGLIKEKKQTKYNEENNKTEVLTFDQNQKLKSKEVIKYNNLGEKTEEWLYGKDNLLKTKAVFKYDSRGLKKEKKVFDPAGKLLQHKVYQYEF